jgi:uncharacterized protein (TIGR03437 family)
LTSFKRNFLIGAIYITAALAALAALAVAGRGQGCTPPIYQGYPSSCSTLNIRWLNQDSSSLIDHFEVYIGSQLRGTAPGNALGFSDSVGCSFGATYTIRQVMRSGATCQTVTTGSAPHTRPCDICGGAGVAGLFGAANGANWRDFQTADSISVGGSGVDMVEGEAFGRFVGVDSNGRLRLDTTLLGMSIEVAGNPCGIFYVNPRQVNFHIPANIAPGVQQVQVTTSSGQILRGTVNIQPENAPGIFTTSGNGVGSAVQVWYLVKANGVAGYYNPGQLPAVTIGDQLYLILFGTGVKSSYSTLLINGQQIDSVYTGPTLYLGQAQFNYPIPFSLYSALSASPTAVVRVWRSADKSNGFWDSQPVEIRR